MENKKIICHDFDNNQHEVEISKLKFRPSVYGILIENNKILLSKQWDGYDVPGGGINIDETIESALKREFFEETGIRIELLCPVHCETSFFHPNILPKDENEFWNCQLIYFLVKKIGGKISKDNCDEEEKEYINTPEWIDLDKIDQIKFFNSIDNVAVVGKAREVLGKL
jgi:8-oxo-dGTP diphosphatase